MNAVYQSQRIAGNAVFAPQFYSGAIDATAPGSALNSVNSIFAGSALGGSGNATAGGATLSGLSGFEGGGATGSDEMYPLRGKSQTYPLHGLIN